MKTTSTMRSALFALLSTLVLLTPPAAAEQAETRQTEPPAAAQDQDEESSTDAAAEPAPADGEGDVESTEVFIPSEEISEDFAVSFPVDI